MVINVTKQTFKDEVLHADKPVLVDFWAQWCGPCSMLAPVIEEIAAENADIKVCKVDIDAQPELAAQFGIMSIPTLAVFKGGQLTGSSSGVQPKEQILSLLD